jgi:alpha-glucosidase
VSAEAGVQEGEVRQQADTVGDEADAFLTFGTDPDWWRTAVVYQIYPRSFADSDGDGLGDLRGVRSRMGYLADLGIDAIWLTPFYPSPLADGGYDIADHRAVDPRLGTLDEFDDLVRAAHRCGIRVTVDVVPNHTSDQHPWFQAALAAGAGSRERERYLFRRGRGMDGELPPSDWQSHFGGSAWQPVGDGEWYLHLFAREQPDLNWQHPEVREYFEGTLRFWADRGVDGFRIDVAHALFKDMSEPLRSQPNLDRELPVDGTDPLYDRNELHALYREWRVLLNSYDPPRPAVAETWMPTNARTYRYARPDELGQVFDFALLKAQWGRDAYRSTIQRSVDDQRTYAGQAGGQTWVLSSHDVPRHASRLALPADVSPDEWLLAGGADPVVDPAVGLRRARAATLMMLALPGSAYLYQGEELGLPEVADLDAAVLQDPVFDRTGGALKGRDGCRVPLPWTTGGPSFGFGPGGSWLPQPATFGAMSVQTQRGAEGSTLEMYREALRLRRRHVARSGPFTWIEVGVHALGFARGQDFRCLLNFGTGPLEIPRGWTVLLSSSPIADGAVPTDAAVWLWAQGHALEDGRPGQDPVPSAWSPTAPQRAANQPIPPNRKDLT